MTNSEKQLLLVDLSGRLPYGVKINIKSDYTREMEDTELVPYHLDGLGYNAEYRNLRPYLRPMSSMTEEEINISEQIYKDNGFWAHFDWLNANHFDYRGLIPMGLALEAKEGMYNYEND